LSQIGIPPLPRPASGSPEDMKRWADDLVSALSAAFGALSAPAGRYEVTGLAAPVRSLDCSGAATALEVADVLGTLVGDLVTVGVITR
jgi:hypothetical protein